jgi:putative transposase
MAWKNQLEWKQSLVSAMRRRRESVAAICDRFGVCRALAYRLWARCDAQGWSGLAPRKRGPKGWHGERAQTYQRVLRQLRKWQPSWGARKLWRLLRGRFRGRRLPSVRTLERWLPCLGLVGPRVRRRRSRPEAKARYRCARRANDRWTMDWKGWVRSSEGRKFEPLTIRDDATGFILYAQPTPTRTHEAVAAVCRRLFRRYGVPKAIRVDLGGPFCGTGVYSHTSLNLWWRQLGIEVEFVQRKAGVHNNAHEQMHGIMAAELMRGPLPTYARLLTRLHRWRRTYNQLRPHDKLHGRTPIALYRPCPAPLPPLRVPTYPSGMTVRRVAPSGMIFAPGFSCYIGRAFAGLPIGARSHQTHWDFYYARQLIRTFDLTTKQSRAPHWGRG